MYHLDLTQFSLEAFRRILETEEMLPSRQILKEQIAERFAALESMGINNLQALIDALSTDKKREQFAQKSGLPGDYLVILRRQARGYIPSPVYFKDIPGVAPEYVGRLADAGIKQTKQLFERAWSESKRAALVDATGIPGGALLELVKLSDLARAGWVGPVFARMLYEAGADTLEALAQWEPEALFEKLQAVNRAQNLTKASFSLKDIASCVEMAKALPKVVEY